ncbi:MAG: ABC transporter substrate-binding protein [Acidaminococcaceae bacterium]|jgi:iron(III) transport system substrate-binding protein|nr:ABC transporter substrate-binding protein [Acidaminococcaceae bacterium]
MMGSKRSLAKALVLGLALLSLTGCGGGEKKAAPAESKSTGKIVQVKSEKEVDLVPLAKKEGSVKVYSITSRISKAGAAFEKKYGIKVEATDMKDFELIDKISTEVKAKAAGADFVIAQDSGRVYGELLSTGYLQNYVPADLASVIPKANQSPLVFVYMNKVLLYNNENGKTSPITNLWQLTEPKNKGKFFFKNPMQEGINANFLTMLTKPEIAEKLAKSYEDLYNKKLKLTTKNAGYEWIKMAFSNGLVMGSSDTSMTEALGVKGQNINSIGLLNYSKIRYAQKKNLAVGVADKVAPFCGFYYPEYALLVKDCKHPAAAKLFIQFLLTEEGYKYWQSDMGSYSGNPKLKGAKGDKPLTDWAKIMVGDDPQYIFENRAEVEEFLSKLI